MAHEILVGLEVIDDLGYQAYREAMTPLLKSYGGSFSYDFKVAEVLISDTSEPINRVFTINFKNVESMKAFFSDEKYLAIKDKHFKNSVTHNTLIASYQKNI